MLGTIFILIAIRQIGRIRLGIWQIMLAGAVVMLATLQISIPAAIQYINFNIILFLIGAFIIGRALEDSGYLSNLESKIFGKVRVSGNLILMVIFVFGIASAFLLNDMVAIIGTPIMIMLSRRHHINPKLLLLALAFAITIGSVTSPIGNPQNLLIATSNRLTNPFVQFPEYLLIPTIINLFVAYLLLRVFYRSEFDKRIEVREVSPIMDKRLASLSKVSLVILVALIPVQSLSTFLHFPIKFELSYISLIASLPILLFSRKRIDIVKGIDWTTIIFFISLFVVVGAVWNSNVIQNYIYAIGPQIGSKFIIIPFGILASQLISNVPFTILYLRIISSLSLPVSSLVALAAGATIAGNLTILGAASNIIIIQNAESRYKETLSFTDFAKVGVLLTIIGAFVYMVFI